MSRSKDDPFEPDAGPPLGDEPPWARPDAVDDWHLGPDPGPPSDEPPWLDNPPWEDAPGETPAEAPSRTPPPAPSGQLSLLAPAVPDALVVMPTGAGKSLCYQLPGLARGGTTLVISPLIALMDDQVAKLRAIGLRAERIHSGLGRGAARQVCRDYLDGELDYLFVAPERLSVPGFTDMLARRKPSLVAIDEAHCISHWGHDFRPDYRSLGGRLPQLRPAPILALTATATPLVQGDILEQLGTPEARRFIHGFRRTNIAVEVVEMRPAARPDAVMRILADPERRPAIVYAPARKKADELGELLARDLPAASYHAGMAAENRDRVQRAFLSGELEVIVATIAFGMGVDKADVRTVVHTGLPSSLEGYYQEIGRAGRDGLPSRAILLYSFADRRTHEFFHERDYPDSLILERIFRKLRPEAQAKEEIQRALHLDPDVFDKALEKLWIHRGAEVTPDERVRRGRDGWQDEYRGQSEHKLAQLENITRFAESPQCRMLALVQHFGDREDSGRPCELCDFCAPQAVCGQPMRAPTDAERAAIDRALAALRERDDRTTGQLHGSAGGRMVRRDFERLLGAMARAGLLDLREDSFDKDGHTIRFRRASLSPEGWRGSAAAIGAVRLPAEAPGPTRSRAVRRGKTTKAGPEPDLDKAPPQLVEALRAWRLTEARRRRIPAFRIMPDRTIFGIAAAQPVDEASLLGVKGIGPGLAKKYGATLLELVAKHR